MSEDRTEEQIYGRDHVRAQERALQEQAELDRARRLVAQADAEQGR